MIWGKPMWGAWWVWDARRGRRVYPVLLIGYMALDAAFGVRARAQSLGGVQRRGWSTSGD